MKILNTALAFVLALALTHSKPSQAALGVSVGVSAPVLAGILVTGIIGGGIYGLSLGAERYWTKLQKFSVYGILYAGAAAGWGLVLLDGEEGQSVSFQEVGVKQAKKLGLNQVELESFNAEVDQVNALAQEVGQNAKTVEEAAALWSELKSEVSLETFSAMVKITAQLQK